MKQNTEKLAASFCLLLDGLLIGACTARYLGLTSFKPMAGLIEATCSITAYMAGLALIFAGLGFGLQRLCGFRSVDLEKSFTAFWMGFAATIAFLQIWHLLFAVSWLALLVVSSFGLLSLNWNRLALRGWLGSLRKRQIVVGLGCALLASAWVANNSAGEPAAYDSGVYHTPAVRWYTTYPVVPGLGNLHGRLALNSSSLLYDAMLEAGPWFGRATHVANGLLVLIFLLQILRSVWRLIRPSGVAIWPYVFELVLILPVTAIIVSHSISSFSTDIPPAIVLFVVCSAVYRLLAERGPEAEYNGVVAVTLAMLSICLKASYAVIGLLLMVLVFSYSAKTIKAIKRSAAIIVLLGIPWMLHGIILSGYPFYPSTFGGLPVDWRVPPELGNETLSWVVVTSRRSTAGGLSWVPAWFRDDMRWYPYHRVPQLSRGIFGVLSPLGLFVLATTGALAAKRERRKGAFPKGYLWLISACLLAAVFWVSMAPNPRFGFALLWSLAAASVARLAVIHESVAPRLALPVAITLAATPVVLPLPQRDLIRQLAGRLVSTPGPDHGLHPYPKPDLYQFTTDSGLALSVPVRDNRCFDAALQCTPHPAPNLVLTSAMDGRPKFVTNGSWQQLNWPNADDDPLKDRFLEQLKTGKEQPSQR